MTGVFPVDPHFDLGVALAIVCILGTLAIGLGGLTLNRRQKDTELAMTGLRALIEDYRAQIVELKVQVNEWKEKYSQLDAEWKDKYERLRCEFDAFKSGRRVKL